MTPHEQLIKAWQNYAEFLSNEISKTATYLFVHNMLPSEEAIKQGEQLRKAIANATALVEQSVPSDEDIMNAAEDYMLNVFATYAEYRSDLAYQQGAKDMRDGKIYVSLKK